VLSGSSDEDIINHVKMQRIEAVLHAPKKHIAECRISIHESTWSRQSALGNGLPDLDDVNRASTSG
jgi:hypothetical protein